MADCYESGLRTVVPRTSLPIYKDRPLLHNACTFSKRCFRRFHPFTAKVPVPMRRRRIQGQAHRDKKIQDLKPPDNATARATAGPSTRTIGRTDGQEGARADGRTDGGTRGGRTEGRADEREDERTEGRTDERANERRRGRRKRADERESARTSEDAGGRNGTRTTATT